MYVSMCTCEAVLFLNYILYEFRETNFLIYFKKLVLKYLKTNMFPSNKMQKNKNKMIIKRKRAKSYIKKVHYLKLLLFQLEFKRLQINWNSKCLCMYCQSSFE